LIAETSEALRGDFGESTRLAQPQGEVTSSLRIHLSGIKVLL